MNRVQRRKAKRDKTGLYGATLIAKRIQKEPLHEKEVQVYETLMQLLGKSEQVTPEKVAKQAGITNIEALILLEGLMAESKGKPNYSYVKNRLEQLSGLKSDT